MSKPTINKWWPQTIQPKNVIVKIAINIESLPKIIHWQYLERISLIIPNAGNISIYTSGWPKNQNKCWNRIKSPPLNGSKNDVLKCLSKIIIVIHPANTGNDTNNRIEVKKIVHGNKGMNNALCKIETDEAFNVVTIKLIDPNKELNPTKCNEKHEINRGRINNT